MVTVDKVDVSSKAQVNDFVELHFRLYKNCPQWVPPFKDDIRTMLNPNKHPFYEHSDAEFFVARRNGEVVGRIAALENKPFNKYHGKKEAEFYLYDTINDREVSDALFEPDDTPWKPLRPNAERHPLNVDHLAAAIGEPLALLRMVRDC